MIVIFIIANLVIALSYFVLGPYVSPRFDIVGSPWGVKVTKYAMLAFFLFCGFTHIEMIVHVLGEPRQDVAWMLSWDMMLIHIGQAIAAPIAAVFTWMYLLIRIEAAPPSGGGIVNETD